MPEKPRRYEDLYRLVRSLEEFVERLEKPEE
jgi:hypothetical protein